MKRVFLSYAHLDLKKARRLCKRLRSSPGVTVWFDKDDLLPGMRWRPAIRKAIRESRYFIALMSKESVAEKGFRHSELRQALEVLDDFPEDDIYLIPTRLDACTPPVDELRKLTYADLFPDWAEGIGQLCQSLGISVKPNAVSTGAKREKRRKQRKAAATGPGQYHYKVGLVDLDDGKIKLQTLARGLNELQRFFWFKPSHLSPSRGALRTMDGKPQLDIDRLTASFYGKIGPLTMDQVVGVTRRYLMISEGQDIFYDYLGVHSPVDERVMFSSVGGLKEYAEEAGISFDTALTYVVVSQLAGFFLDIDYHDALRGCPWDYTKHHEDIVDGLRDAHICTVCSKKLKQNPKLRMAVNAMLGWGR